jgi:fluoroquinolone transport system permease protein
MERWAVDLTPYLPLIVSYFILGMSSVLFGMIGGFLLLETREDRTIRAMLVSPVPLRTYLVGFCTALVLGANVVSVTEGLIVGLALPPFPVLVAAAVVCGLSAPMMAMFLAAASEDKVAAFAQMKIVSTAGLVPVAAWFAPEPWQWLAGIYPPYLASKAYWVAEAGGNGWPWLAAGVVVSAVWLVVFERFFDRAARR